MSMLKPGEDPASRYCYTCETTAGGAQMAATLGAASSADIGDDLQLMPLEGGDREGGPRRGRMAPGRRPNFKPAAKASPRPATGSRNNMPAVTGSRSSMPAATGSRANMAAAAAPEAAEIPLEAQQPEQRPSRANIPAARRGSSVNLIPAVKSSGRLKAVPGGKTSATMAAVAMPAGRSSARQKAIEDAKKKNLVTYGAIGGAVLLCVIVLFAMRGGKKPLPADVADTEAKSSKPNEEPRLALAPVAAPAPKPAETKVEAPKAADTPKEAVAEPAKAAPDKNAALTDALRNIGTRKAANAKLDDDDAEVATPKATPRESDPAEKPVAAQKPAEPAAPAAPPAPPELGPDGEPKKSGDPLVGLGLKKKAPEKEELKPGAKPAPIPVTATEPSFVPIDFAAGDRNQETTFSENVNRIFPGWRVRDIKLDVSSAGGDQRGRPDCLTLQPLNDVLPTKLIATLEIPQSFAQKRPMLLFEASIREGVGKTASKPMFVSVRAMNVEILPKQIVKGTKELPWLETGVNLSMLAGKRVEIQIEMCVPPKTKPDQIKDHIGYIRNIRLEWTGKPKTVIKK